MLHVLLSLSMPLDESQSVEPPAPDPRDARIAELEREVAVRDEYVSYVSHELRNPVSPLYMQVALMRERIGELPADVPVERAWVERELATMGARVDHFLSALTRLLDASRIGEGQLDLHPTHCDLVEIARAAVAGFPEVRAMKLDVEVEAPLSLKGHWDRLRIEQIISNLVSNAIRYGLGRPVTVALAAAPDERVRIVVEDRGTGIAEGDLPHIFERFKRVGNPAIASGFGIGLWVIAKLVDVMRGTIEVRSQVGVGTAFTITLPRVP